jgi:hypothetical protein
VAVGIGHDPKQKPQTGNPNMYQYRVPTTTTVHDTITCEKPGRRRRRRRKMQYGAESPPI